MKDVTLSHAEIVIHNAIFAGNDEHAVSSPPKAVEALVAANLLATPKHDAGVLRNAARLVFDDKTLSTPERALIANWLVLFADKVQS